MNESKILKTSIYGGIAISLIVLIYFVIALWTHDYYPVCPFNDEAPIDGQFTGQVGDFIGGVVGSFLSLASIFLLILTLREQQNEKRKDSFEQTLRSMIDRYNSITESIHYKDQIDKSISGKDAISQMLDNYIYLLKLVIQYINEKLKQDNNLKSSFNEESAERFAMKLAYGYFMYGIDDYFITRDKSSAEYELNVDVTSYLKSISDYKLECWITHRSSQLGHYFRCIFYIVKFVASQEWLSEDEKYQYVKQLRSLMSDKEQILLYYNALSVLGEPWIKPLGKTKIEEMCYMARFRMIKNIPYYFEYVGINPKRLFKTEVQAYNKMGKKFFEIDLENQKSFCFSAFSTSEKDGA